MRATVLLVAAAAGCGRAPPSEQTPATTAPLATAVTAASPSSAPAGAPPPSSAPAGAPPPSRAPAAAPPPSSPTEWAQRLGPLVFHDVNSLESVTLRLYKDDGSLDEDAAAEADRVLWAPKEGDPPHMNRRLLQLVVKAAAQFDAREVQVISSYRGKARKGSRHRSGEAMDFVFPGVSPKKIAAVLRTYPRVGVGEYVHPRSQFVHLDVREMSYHWIDGSPPGRSWKEHALPDPTAQARDAAYTPEQDLPK